MCVEIHSPRQFHSLSVYLQPGRPDARSEQEDAVNTLDKMLNRAGTAENDL